AAQTCLTCTASFCLQHLRPHQDSPAFRDHQLCPPLRDLQQRKCPKHNKLFEFFCSQHGSCICSLCLLGHKLCHTSPLQPAKVNAEVSDAGRRGLEHPPRGIPELPFAPPGPVLCPQTVLLKLVSVCSCLLQEIASRKRDLIKNEFSEIKALIEERENQTLKVIADEEKRVCSKFDYIYGVLGSKKKEIQSLRDQIEMALTEADDILFLKRAAALQRMSTKDAFVPVIEMDQNLMLSTYQSAVNLKDIVKLSVTQEKKVEGTVSLGELAFSALSLSSNKASSPSNPNMTKKKKINSAWSRRPNREPREAHCTLRVSVTLLSTWSFFPTDLTLFSSVNTAPTPGTLNAAAAASTKELLDSFLKKSREELLQYAANITLDYNTAHNKVIVSDRYTRMSVSDTPMNYNDHPQRFTDCYQVLGFQCFKRGIHYWEVELQQNNFCGIGICYGSMDRQGPESRLGRNSSSWCIEWFNSKISSWHNDVEKRLPNVKATKIGVLLHCEGGFVIFMAVGEKHNLIYKFKAQFTEALYPAFWLFSSGTVLSLCQV
ncbi:E3 ubiquitin/ISG15 ligase TRIM25, partial [Tauraco erythrolophus]